LFGADRYVFSSSAGAVLVTLQLDCEGCCVRISPTDPTVVFVGGDDGLLLKWNTATGTQTPLEGHQNHVYGLCVSDDGTTVASGSYDETVRLWDTAMGGCLWTSTQAGGVMSVAMHGDTVFCGVHKNNTVGLWKSDGTAGPTFAKAGEYPIGLAVTRGEQTGDGARKRRLGREKMRVRVRWKGGRRS
jgi:WD40 repeat protein